MAKRFFRSVKEAWRGLGHTFKHEQNFRLQSLVAIGVLILAYLFSLRVWEIVLLILLIFAVLVMELLNTAMEKFADLLVPRLHHQVEVIKDVMAAAVLFTSLGAAIIGVIIFSPHLVNLFK